MFLVMTVLDIVVVVLNADYYIPVIEGFIDIPRWGTLVFWACLFHCTCYFGPCKITLYKGGFLMCFKGL